MGTNISKQKIESMTTQINNALTTASQKVRNTHLTSNKSKQKLNLIAVGATNCGVNVNQKLTSSLSAMSQFGSEVANEVSNALKNSLTEEIAQIAKQKNEGINFGQTNVSDLNTYVNDYLINNMQTDIQTEINNIVEDTVDSTQEITINASYMNCNGKDIIINQEMIIEQISSNIANTLVKNAVENVAENEAVKKITQTADQSNAGLTFGGMIFLLIAAAAFTFFFGYKIMCYIIPIFIAVVAYGIYYYSQTNLKITLGVLIVCEIILICLELYFIYKAVRGSGNSNLIPIPKSIQIPAVSISTQSSTQPSS